MKKIKIVLSSLALLAIVGGALAFNVKTGEYVCTVPKPAEGCTETLKCQTMNLNSIPDLSQTDVCYRDVSSSSIICSNVFCDDDGGAKSE